MTKITHADTPSPTWEASGFDVWGNKVWQENELRQRTNYAYDLYNRVTLVSDPVGNTTAYDYSNIHSGRSNPAGSQTSNSPHIVTDAAGVNTANLYDDNLRKTSSQLGSNPAASYVYDAVGNQTDVTDPRGTGYTTTTTYDARNRKTSVKDPINPPTSFYYDDGINLTRIVRSDGRTESKTYDNLNRLSSHTEPVSPGVTKTTNFDYTSGGMLFHVTDPKTQVTTFQYNEADLKIQMIYPDSATDDELWDYDAMYNLKSRTTVNNEQQTFQYDLRNRQTHMSWSNTAIEWADFQYDAAGRMVLAKNATPL